MKANRSRKMPPGSAESLPPSNAKPYTPSLSNGVSKPARDGATLLTPSLGPAPAMSDPDHPKPYAHKHFKKRYLAAAEPSSLSPGSGSGGTAPPSPSLGAAVSPEAADACEALLELGRTQGAGPRTTSRSSDESGSGSDTARSRGSPSDSQPLQSLREAVWTKVATNILKQVDEKLQEPPKDSPMNLSASAPAPVIQCTIRDQQIIEHIIENILDKPMEGQACIPCEPINVSVNNNQEEGIKASIYESLKNDLLKGVKTPLMMTSSKSAPTTPPGGARLTPVSVSSSSGNQPKNSLPVTKPSPLPHLVPLTQTAKLPLGAVHKMTSVTSTVSSHSAPNSATPSPSASSAHSPATHSPNSITPPGHQDVLRLLARSSQLPLTVGNSAITITKTPRVSLSQPHHIPHTVATVSPTPVSVSLTRTGSNQVFNLGPALTNGGPTSGSVTSIAGVPMVFTSQPGMVLTTGGHGPGPSSVVLTGLAGHGGQPGECVLLSPAGAAPSQAGAGVILQQAMGGALHQGQVVIAPAGGQPLLIPAGSKLILAPPVPPVVPGHTTNSHNNPVNHEQTSSDPVNLTVSKLRPHPEADNNRESASSNLLSVSPSLATLKRPASLSDGEEEDIRRSSRQTKGKRYQEFIEDGRINVNSRQKRRSHRSGEEDEAMSTVEPLPQGHVDTKLTMETQSSTQSSTGMNHWKKKMRTVSLGETQLVTSPASITASPGQHERLRAQHLVNKVSLAREPEPESAVRPPHQISRSTRQHSHHNPQPSRTGATIDVKLGNKKLRGEKISH